MLHSDVGHVAVFSEFEDRMPRKLIGVNEAGRRVGEDHPSAKLTDHEVELLLKLHDQGWGYRRLARKFGIHRATVADICTARYRAQPPTRFK